MTEPRRYFRPDPFPEDVHSTLEGQTVLLTGGGGFLGQYVQSALTTVGAQVFAPRSAALDLTRQEAVESYIKTHQPRYIVHLAAECGGIGANVAHPGRFLYANALMGLMLLESARQNAVLKTVMVSTTCAYPQDAPLPLREESLWDGKPTGATGPYGMAKRLLHEAVASYASEYGLRGVVLIPANLYGPGDHFDESRSHVVPAMIRRYVEAMRTKQSSITNWGSGSPTREFLHARDAARAIVLATARHEDAFPVNLGTGVETSIADLATAVAEAVGYTGQLLWDTSKPDGQPRRYLDVQRARAFGFVSETNLKTGLEETVRWYKTESQELR